MTRRNVLNGLLHTFRAEQIATLIAGAVSVDLQANPQEEAAKLVSRRFDQAPVTFQGHISGWVLTENLKNAPKVRGAFQPLEKSAIVSADASIADVLDLLAAEGLVFTVDKHGIAGFIAPSDLDRNVARGQFYLLIASLEMVLADIVQSIVPEERLVALMHGELLERWTSSSAENTEARAVEYLYLEDLANLFVGSDFGTGFSEEMCSTMTELCQLRPVVMHPTRPLLGDRTPTQLASLARRGEELLVRLDELVPSS
jgi:hypothetical protein